MKELFDDLKDLAGVLGACLYHNHIGVLETNMPAVLTADKLLEIGKLLAKVHAAGRMNMPDLGDVTLQFDESVILVREVEENLIIFILCDPGFNQNLITMSLNLVLQEMKNQLQPLSEAIPKDKPQEAPSGDVVQILRDMEIHLLKILGPMASMVFEETVEYWQEKGNSSKSDLGSLVELLAEEIGSADKITSYKEMIAPVIKQGIGGL